MQENYRYTGKTDEETGNDEWGDRGGLGEELHCYYNNDNSNSNKYGALYNWYATTANNFAPKKIIASITIVSPFIPFNLF